MPSRKAGAVESKILLEEFGGQGHFDSKEYRAKDIRKDFNGFHGHKPSFSEDQIQEVLERMGKHNKQDELNCACCGYSSCREKAIAVLEGKAQVEMCLPYLMEKAKSVSAHIYENSPNGILTASKEWKIELANQAAEKLFGISKETMLGKDLSELIPMELIADAVEKGRAENKKLNLESGKVVEATVLFSEKYGTLMAILHDRTEREAEHQANLKRRKEATSLANEVIEKNMAAVQQIAQLLGESCIHVFDEITDNLPQNEASFNLAKQNLMKSIQSRRVTKAGVINAYFNAKLMGIDYDVTKLYYEQLPSLTLQDITNFEKQNIVGKPYRMVILGDEKNLDMKSLEKIAPIKRLSQEEIFGY